MIEITYTFLTELINFLPILIPLILILNLASELLFGK